MLNLAIAFYLSINPNIQLKHCFENEEIYYCELIDRNRRQIRLPGGMLFHDRSFLYLREVETVLLLQEDGRFLNLSTGKLES